jgi:hypothetical protein
MNGAWVEVEIAGKRADVYEPSNRPPPLNGAVIPRPAGPGLLNNYRHGFANGNDAKVSAAGILPPQVVRDAAHVAVRLCTRLTIC